MVNIKEDVGPQSVNHYGQLPAVNISFGLKPGVSLGTAIDHVNEVARQVLPATVTTSFQGSAKVFQASLSNLSLLFFIAIGVVYIVLGMLYESYIHPITILSGLPSAALGGLLTLWLFGNELNIYSFVGLILLIGLVMKNAIMQIDFALEAERQHEQDAGRSDLRRLHRPLPSDHDDDGWRRCSARCRSRSDSAPAARRGGRWASPWSAAWWSRRSSRSI